MENLQNKIKIQFKNKTLYNTAFTHRSYLNENKSAKENNERLEFLGDAVLELSVTDFLFDKFPTEPEGKLTNLRSSLVKKETLASVARELGLGPLLKLSKGEDLGGGRENDYLLANTLEALIGALYLDQGFELADEFILKFISQKIDTVLEEKSFIDSKSKIQAFVQADLKVTPRYKILKDTGPDHDKTFLIGVFANEALLAVGDGPSKQSAQQSAAQSACDKFGLKK